jgi:hypothetical protein
MARAPRSLEVKVIAITAAAPYQCDPQARAASPPPQGVGGYAPGVADYAAESRAGVPLA